MNCEVLYSVFTLNYSGFVNEETAGVLDTLPTINAGNVTFNPQTGLYVQGVTVQNPNASELSAFRILITELRSDVRVQNATGKTNGGRMCNTMGWCRRKASLFSSLLKKQSALVLRLFPALAAIAARNFLVGGYLAAKMVRALSDSWSLFGGVQYQNVGDYSQEAGSKPATVDLGESIFVSTGIGFSF